MQENTLLFNLVLVTTRTCLTQKKVKQNLKKYSTNKKPRKRANSNSPLSLTEYLKQALIGLTLGDVSLEKATSNSNIRLRFDQSSSIHSDYVFFLYQLFKDYTLSPPKSTNRKPDKRTGKIYNSLIFKTRMLPCFNYLWELFYRERVKTIPNNIGELLTEVGLAFWIMDDGGLGSNGTLNIHTDSYTSEDVDLLIKVLNCNFQIDSRKSLKRPSQWIIVIPKKEVHKVAELTVGHMHPSMFYKIGR